MPPTLLRTPESAASPTLEAAQLEYDIEKPRWWGGQAGARSLPSGKRRRELVARAPPRRLYPALRPDPVRLPLPVSAPPPAPPSGCPRLAPGLAARSSAARSAGAEGKLSTTKRPRRCRRGVQHLRFYDLPFSRTGVTSGGRILPGSRGWRQSQRAGRHFPRSAPNDWATLSLSLSSFRESSAARGRKRHSRRFSRRRRCRSSSSCLLGVGLDASPTRRPRPGAAPPRIPRSEPRPCKGALANSAPPAHIHDLAPGRRRQTQPWASSPGPSRRSARSSRPSTRRSVAKSFADFIALDESLSALSSEPFTGAVALKAKVDAYLALSDQATELKLISKNIADVPTESAQKRVRGDGREAAAKRDPWIRSCMTMRRGLRDLRASARRRSPS